MTESQKLLAEYTRDGSEPAFRQLVARYLDLVYSAAVRLVEGDTHRAKDVSQMVFADLARLAPTLPGEIMLGGWLHRHTCFVAATLMRSERRRRFRERQAVEMSTLSDHTEANLAQVAPVLDEAINALGTEDRTAILLRFFEHYDFRAVGETLGTSENAAQKRVSRALEQLRLLLKRRGVAFSTAALGTALAGEAVAAAPAGFVLAISNAALAGTAAGAETITFLKLATMTKLKFGFMSAVLVAGVATPLLIQQRTQAGVRSEIQTLQQHADRLAQLKADGEQLSNRLAQADRSSLSSDQFNELLRLRGEVGSLRTQTKDLPRVREQNQQLRAGPARGPNAVKQAPEAVEFYYPKNTLTFAGYTTPEDTLKSGLWALSQGNIPGFLDSLDDKLREQIAKDWSAKTPSEMAQKVDGINQSPGFRVRKMVIAEDAVLLELSPENSTNQHEKILMRKIDGQWKGVEP